MPIHLQAGDVPPGIPEDDYIAERIAPNAGLSSSISGLGLLSRVDCGDVLDFRGYGARIRSYSATANSASGGERMVASILGADELTSLRDAGTSSSLNLSGHQLSQAALDQLFTDLPATTRTATINVGGNPGAVTCDPSIATAKGYTVVT